MPDTIAALVWIVGGGALILLTTIVAFFLKRLITELDKLREAMSAGFKETNKTLREIEKDLGSRVNDCESRITVIERSGCMVATQCYDGPDRRGYV